MNIKDKAIKFLEEKRVFLRPLEQEDLDFLYTNLWHQESRRLTGTQTIFSKQGVQTWFENVSSDSSRMDLVICLQEDNKIIGDIAMIDIDHQNRNANVRLAIYNEDLWGKGYGTEALRLLLKHSFEILNLHRVQLDVFSYNKRAIKAYEKVGFKREGAVRDALYYDGEYHDSIIMGILENEFQRK